MHPRHSLSFCAFVVALSLWLAVSGAAVAAGEVDPTFGTLGYTLTPMDNSVTPHLAVDGSDRILVARYVGTNQYDFGLSRYTADGALDSTFGTGGVAPAVDFFSGGNDTPCGVVVLTQGANAGKIVVAGTATNLNPVSTYLALARYNSNGTLDTTFGTNGKVTVMVGPLLSNWSAVTIDGSDNLYVAGEYSNLSNDYISTVVKLTAAGAVVQTYEANVATGSVNWQLFESPYAVAVQSDGKVVAGGYKNGGANGVNAMSLMRFTAAGPGLDTSGFNSPNGWLSLNFGASTPNDLVGGIAIQSDGKIVAAGNGLTVNGGKAAFFAARFNTDGTLDTTGFGSGTGKVVVDVAGGGADLYNALVQSDGKIVLFGIAYSSTSAPWHVAVVRLNSNGSLDTTFGSGGKRLLDFGGQTQQGSPEARLQSTGKLVFGANTTLGAGNALGLGRLIMADQAMAYDRSATTQNTADVQRGVDATHVIGLQISVIGSQSPLALTSLTFNTTGTTSAADVSQAQVYYTGTDAAFSRSTPVGAPFANPNGTFTISLNQSLVSGVNYFWLVYTIPASATVNNVVDAECTAFTLGGVARSPTPTAPTGNRRIVAAFYPPVTGDTQYGDAITRFAFGTIDNASGVSAGGYGDYSGSVPAATIQTGQTLTAAVTISGTFTGTDGADYWVKIWVDWNHNFDFGDAGEAYVIVSTARTVGPWTGPIPAPPSALAGATRMRVATQWRDAPLYAGNISMGGEAEDYALNVTLPAAPDVGVHKVRNGTGVVAGQPVSYTITVTNSGTAAATGWTVSDSAPAALTGATWTCASSGGATCGAAGGSGSINQTVNVPVGGVATYVLSATVSAGATGVLSNTASVAVPGGATDSDLSNNTATAQDTIVRPADLSIAKTDLAAAVVPGTALVYTITVTNSGPLDVTGATVTDALPAALTGATWTCAGAGGGTCGAANGNGAINQAVNLPVGASVTYVATATVGSAATGTLANTATVAVPAGVTELNPADNTATDTDTLTPRADLILRKSSALPTVVPGGTVTYTLGVTNTGPSNAPAAQLSDPFGAPFTAATWTCVAGPGAACTGGSGPMNNVALSLSAGASVTYTAVATVAASATGTLGNNADIGAGAGVTELNPANNAGGVTVTLTPRADLVVSQTGSINPVVAGSGANNLTYVITLTNRGLSDAAGVTVHETLGLPAGVSLDAVTPGMGTWAGSDWSLASLPAGGHATLVLTLTVASQTAAGTNAISSTAAVASAGTPLVNTGDDAATVLTSVARAVDLSIAKTDGTAAVIPGLPLVYTITVTNSGPSDADGAGVTDAFPAMLDGVTWTCSGTGGVGGAQCGAVRGSGAISQAVDLPAGAGLTYVATATVGAGAAGTLANTASITVPVGTREVKPADNTATDVDALTPTADLSLHKSSAEPTMVPGATVTYTLVVSNAGPSNAPDARLSDPFGAPFAAAVWTCAAGPGAACGGGAGPMNAVAVSLPAGSIVTYTAVATVASSATGAVGNTASVSAGASVTDPNPADNAGGVTVTLTPLTDLFVTQTGSDDLVIAGSGAHNLTYVITVTNRGPSDAAGVTLGEALGLPAGVGLDTATPGAGTWDGSAWSLAALPVGNHATLTLTLTVGPHAAAGTDAISSTATVTASGTPLIDTGDDTATVWTSVARHADLSISKTDGVDAAVPGTTFVYTIVVTNSGPSDVDGATVTDAVPPALSGLAWTCAGAGGGTCGAVGETQGALSDAVQLPVGTWAMYQVTGTVQPAATGLLTNAVHITSPADTTELNPGDNVAVDVDALTPVADLVAAKSAQPTAIPGLPVTYTIVISNAGPSDAPAARVVDVFGPSLLAPVWTCAAGPSAACVGGSGPMTNVVLSLPAGATVTYTAVVTVASSATGVRGNTARAAPGPGVTEALSANNTATATVSLSPLATLIVEQAGSVDPVTAGSGAGNLTYIVTVTNTGPSDAGQVVVGETLSLPAGVSLDAATASAGALAGGDWTVPSLPAGGRETLTLTLTAGPQTVVGTDVISATASAASADAALTPDSRTPSTVSTSVVRDADLAVAKSVQPDRVWPGQALTYTLTYTNNGPSQATNVVITDVLLPQLTEPAFVSNPDVTAIAGGFLIGTLDVHATGVITITARMDPTIDRTVTVANRADIGADERDPTPGDNSSEAGVWVPVVDLAVAKSVTPPRAGEGAPVTFIVTAYNASNTPATAVVVSDTLPAGLSPTGESATGGSYSAPYWTIPSLADGETVTLTLQATVDAGTAGQTLTNTVRVVSAAEYDRDAANDTATAAVRVLSADLGITATAPATATPGLTMTWTVTVTNDGPDDIEGVVSDTLPAAIASATWTCAANGGATCAAGSGDLHDSVSLPVGSRAVYAVHADVRSSATGTVDNTASVAAAPGIDHNPANDVASTSTVLSPSAGLSVRKTVRQAPNSPDVVYTIVAANAGPSDAPGAVLSDTAPAGLTGFDWTCASGGGAACPSGSGAGSLHESLSLPTGGVVTYTVAGALADLSRSVVNTVEIQAPATVPDPDPTDNLASARSALRMYLPLVERGVATLPDLQVTDLVATTQAVTVTVHNAGAFEVHDPFWVDVYFNPRQTPRVNQPWPTLAPAGVAFGVTRAIPAGGSLTLTMSGPYYSPGNSSHPPFPDHADVYAYVDSVNFGTTYGMVLETREDNNLAGPVRSVAGGAVRMSGAGSTAGLPGR